MSDEEYDELVGAVDVHGSVHLSRAHEPKDPLCGFGTGVPDRHLILEPLMYQPDMLDYNINYCDACKRIWLESE